MSTTTSLDGPEHDIKLLLTVARMLTVYTGKNRQLQLPVVKTQVANPYWSLVAGVAQEMWKHREKLSGGARQLWNMVSGGGSKKARGKRVTFNQLMGSSKNYSSRSDVQPIAVNLTQNNPVWAETSVAPPRSEGPGIRICGRQLFTQVTGSAGDSQLFSNAGGGATVDSINRIFLSPDTLNGRIAKIASVYNKYVFRHVRLVYVPRQAYDTAGAFDLGLWHDVDADVGTPTFATVLELVPSVLAAYRDTVALEYNYAGDELWFTEANAATGSLARQTLQAAIYGFPDSSPAGTTHRGTIMIEFCCDLYDLSFDLGFTLAVKDHAELEALRKYQTWLRLRDSEDRVERFSPRDRRTETASSLRKAVAIYEAFDPMMSPRVSHEIEEKRTV